VGYDKGCFLVCALSCPAVRKEIRSFGRSCTELVSAIVSRSSIRFWGVYQSVKSGVGFLQQLPTAITESVPNGGDKISSPGGSFDGLQVSLGCECSAYANQIFFCSHDRCCVG
jgi:hypothetical protein